MALDYVSIKGRLGVKVADSADEGDAPDLVYCDEGRIQFTPTLEQTVAAGEDPPVVLGMHPVTVIIDGQGYLSHQGVRYVKLPDLHSEKINPRIDTGKATWTVTFLDVKANGEKVTFTGGRIDPLPGDNDLVELLPVQPASGGTIAITRGPAGVGVPEGGTAGQVLAKSTGDDYDTEWVAQSSGGGSGDVASVNGQTGAVVLDAADVGARADDWTPDLSGYATTSALTSGLAGKANTAHTQAISTVTGLQTALDGKATTAQGAKADTAVQPGDLAPYAKTADIPAAPTWGTISGKPAVVAEGTSQTAARDAIGAGTSNLQLGTGSTTAKAGDYTPTVADVPNLPASKVTSGTLDAARIPTLAQSKVTNLTTDLANKVNATVLGNVTSFAYGTTLPGTGNEGDIFFLIEE